MLQCLEHQWSQAQGHLTQLNPSIALLSHVMHKLNTARSKVRFFSASLGPGLPQSPKNSRCVFLGGEGWMRTCKDRAPKCRSRKLVTPWCCWECVNVIRISCPKLQFTSEISAEAIECVCVCFFSTVDKIKWPREDYQQKSDIYRNFHLKCLSWRDVVSQTCHPPGPRNMAGWKIHPFSRWFWLDSLDRRSR